MRRKKTISKKRRASTLINNTTENAVIVFLRKRELGKVKTRLAATIGPKRALAIYHYLIKHTLVVVDKLNAAKILYFYPEIEQYPNHPDYNCYLQKGQDLGNRLINAIDDCHLLYQKIVVIGTDCPYLEKTDLEHAFQMLDKNDIVIGPSEDGGYYLIGLKKPHPHLFLDIDWSTDRVFDQTLKAAKTKNLVVGLLRTLSDVDYEKDWVRYCESTGTQFNEGL
ncbi:MAG: TIGR04282 family arsenosugar biosynthesis glycosyltransferase [Saprospiraceae bacterium]|nr:TIGR04282 family arsenosugar biosynthesis glycosyltransferase [Saprospiraceae bacterium]